MNKFATLTVGALLAFGTIATAQKTTQKKATNSLI